MSIGGLLIQKSIRNSCKSHLYIMQIGILKCPVPNLILELSLFWKCIHSWFISHLNSYWHSWMVITISKLYMISYRNFNDFFIVNVTGIFSLNFCGLPRKLEFYHALNMWFYKLIFFFKIILFRLLLSSFRLLICSEFCSHSWRIQCSYSFLTRKVQKK